MTTTGKLLNPTDTGHDVILLAGQSNAVGFGDGAVDFTYLDAADPRISQWPGSGTYYGLGRPVAAVDPLFHHQAASAGTVGHALTFCKQYQRTVPTNRKVLVVPCAHDTTGFTTTSVTPPPTGYHASSVLAPGGCWDPAATDGGTNLAQFAVTQTNAALAESSNNRIVAILWLQGESDATYLNQAQYAAKLDALIAYFRANITGATNVPFILGQMVPEQTVNTGYPAVNLAHIDTPNRVVRTGFWYGTSGKRASNPIHYNNEGQRLNGYKILPALTRARANVLGTAPPVPAAPTLAQAGPTTASVAWVQPTGRVTDFNVRYSTNGGSSWTTLSRTQSIDVTASLTGMTPGAALLVQVRSVNEQGNSAWSSSSSLTLAQTPNAPTGLTLGTPTQSTIPVSWTASATDGSHSAPVTYLVQTSPHSANTWTTAATITAPTVSTTLTGLAAGTQYDVQVIAVNPAGNSAATSTATATTTTPTPVIDAVGVTAQRAYGLRKLRTAYAGSAIRVRRSSDSTESDIGFTAGGELDTATLLTFAGAGSAYVKTWYDQSGSAWDLTQTTAANQARVVNAGVLDALNSHATARFASSFYSDTHTGLYANGSASVLGVLEGESGGQSFATMFAEAAGAGGSNTIYNFADLVTPSSIESLFTDSAGVVVAQVIAGSFTLNTLHQFSSVDTGTSWQNFCDAAGGTAITYSRGGHTFTPTKVTLGSIFGTTAFAWPGCMSEWVVFAAALTTGQRQAGEANQKSYYGTP